MHLSSRWYEQKRNKLISMLEEATSLEIPKRYAEELENASKKGKENAFEIVLVSEFQGGKSTTFNALCDGRDISPRGLGGGGIKTSATVISAQNISGDETKNGLSEWAELSFKTSTNLALGMYNLLFPVLRNNKTFRSFFPKLSDSDFTLKISSMHDFAEMLDLDNEKHLRVLKKIITSLWKQWQAGKMSFSDDDLDMLKIITLQVKFYNSSKYRKMLNDSVLPINDFQNLVAFPRNWAIEWLKGEDADFLFHEIAFVFISSVLVRIHSKNLARIGCRITDCPGLFANAYDTSVTKQTIAQADAVWYLLDGEKQIAQKDLKMLPQIYSMGMHDKLNIIFNIRSFQEQKIKEILPVTVAVLENSGYNVQVDPYNARLAFLATQGDLLLNEQDKFSERDLECMRIDSKIHSKDIAPAELWFEMIKRLAMNLYLTPLERITELNSEATEVVRKASYLDDILKQTEEYVINKKSKSILVDNGSKKAIQALEDFEGELKLIEEAARNKEKEWKEKSAKARKQLKFFYDSSIKILDDSDLLKNLNSLSERTADEIINDLLKSEILVKNTAMILSKAIWETISEFAISKKKWNDLVINKALPDLIEESKNALVRSLKNWHNEEKTTFAELKFRLEDICDDFHNFWKKQEMDINPFFDGLSLPRIEQDELQIIYETLSLDILSMFLLTESFWGSLTYKKSFSKLLQKLASFFGKKSELVDKVFKDLVTKSQDYVVEQFSLPEFRNSLHEPLVKKINEIQNNLIARLVENLENILDDFEQNRYIKSFEQFQKSQSERQRIASKNVKLRKNKIQPLRERLQQFEKTVLEIV